MKILLFLLVILAGAATIGTRAEAQNYPWCAIYDMGDAAVNCGFVSSDQCMATVRGIGGFCTPNTQYQPAASIAHPPHRHHQFH